LIAQTIQLTSGICRRHRVELIFQDSAAIPILTSVPQGELKQVLYNVILNAVQASTSGSKVDIQIEADDGQAVIRVTDYGSGIPADVLPKIFDPFFTTKHGGPQSGMGLGLSVSQSLMEAMGGQIQVESIPGKQTRFTLIVPRRNNNSV
jgi:signal transduction histidine kinase